MRTSIITLFLLLIVQLSIAQENSKQSDTLTKKRTTPKQNLLFIKFHSISGFGMVKPKTAYYNFGSMAGSGAEFILGFKLQPKVGLGFGMQRSYYFLNQTKVEEGLEKTYTQPWMSAVASNTGQSTLQQTALFVYLSGWKQKEKNILEYYTKMSLNSFQYHLHSQVNRTSNTGYSIGTTYDGGISNMGFLAALGLNYSRRISKILYVGGGLEYAFNFSPKTLLYENNLYSTGEKVSYQVELPTAAHLLQMKIGVMYRPKKACNCKEQKPW
jgi:hypothetical protein